MDNKWHSGPPPSIGWWPASIAADSACLRWWNGQYWSIGAYRGYSEVNLARIAVARADTDWEVRWQYRPKSWPKRSRT
jgi:hypothetical protein